MKPRSGGIYKRLNIIHITKFIKSFFGQQRNIILSYNIIKITNN